MIDIKRYQNILENINDNNQLFEILEFININKIKEPVTNKIISLKLSNKEFESMKMNRIDSASEIISIIKNQVNQEFHNSAISSILKNSKIEYLDISKLDTLSQSNNIVEYILSSKRRGFPENIIVCPIVLCYIMDSNIKIFEKSNTSNTFNSHIYKAGKLDGITIWVNHYMKYEMCLFNKIEAMYNLSDIYLQSDGKLWMENMEEIHVRYKNDFITTQSKRLLIMGSHNTEEYDKFIRDQRNKKIIDIIG